MIRRGSKKRFREFVRTVKADPHRYYYIKSTIASLKEDDIDINNQDSMGRTLLHLAIKMNDYKLFKLFVSSGVILDLANEQGEAPIHRAVIENKLDFVKYLVNNGADINIGAEQEQTPLHLAVINGNLEMVKYLVDHGADIYLLDERNNLPIDYAIDECDEKLIKYFLTKQSVGKEKLEIINSLLKGGTNNA